MPNPETIQAPAQGTGRLCSLPGAPLSPDLEWPVRRAAPGKNAGRMDGGAKRISFAELSLIAAVSSVAAGRAAAWQGVPTLPCLPSLELWGSAPWL